MTSDHNYNYLYKVILVGDSGVGKTNIVSRFVDDSFTDSVRSTIGIDFQVKVIDTGSEKIKLQIWDTAGQERFRSISRSYYKYAYGIIVVFDLTNRKSFENIEKWINDVETLSEYDLTYIELLLIGNKADLDDKRQVFDEDIKALQDTYSFTYIETSAKNNTGIQDGFVELAQRIHANRDYLRKKDYEVVSLSDNQNIEIEPKSRCC